MFRAETLPRFDFSQAPGIVRRLAQDEPPKDLDLGEWSRVQARYLDPAHARAVGEAEAAMRESVLAYDRFFGERGLLRGDVLDVGGSVGLYRQWWDPGASGVYVVHDPAVGTPRMQADELMRRHYPRAFELPLTCVEGFGEDLPYRAAVFDTCLIVATLDHSADPVRVLGEVRRCLRPGGVLVLLQSCRLPAASQRVGYSMKHGLRSPRRLLRKLGQRLAAAPEKHMHRFDVDGLASWLAAGGFDEVQVRGPLKRRVFAFEGRRPAARPREPVEIGDPARD